MEEEYKILAVIERACIQLTKAFAIARPDGKNLITKSLVNCDMKLTKTKAYFFFVFALLTICLLYQAVWLISDTTKGEILIFGRGAGDDFKHVENVRIRYVVQNKEYVNTYLRNGLDGATHTIPIKYLIFAPSISRMDTLIGNWGLVLVVSVIILFSLSICFLIQDIIPNGSFFVLSISFPFVRLKKPKGQRDPNDQYAW